MWCGQRNRVVGTRIGAISARLPILVMALSIFPCLAESAWADLPPVAEDDYGDVGAGVGAEIPLLANDWADSGSAEDPNGIVYSSVEIVAEPQGGVVFVDPDTGDAYYLPNAGFYGYDSFTYRFRDQWGQVSNSAFVLIWVNDPPVITGFKVVNPADNVWYVEGTVQDLTPAGLTVTFGGILEGIAVTTAADGSFGHSFTLEMGGGGPVTAQTSDPQGLSSDIAEAIVFE